VLSLLLVGCFPKLLLLVASPKKASKQLLPLCMICFSWMRQHARKLLTDSSPLTHSTLERAVSPEFGTARGHLGVASETPGRSGEKMA